MICWMNGNCLPAGEALISPFDHGFLYGIGFFETFRTYEGSVYLFDEHMDRLRQALSEYHIAMPYTDDQIRIAVRELTAKSGGKDGYFRLNVSAGEHDIGLAPTYYDEPNVILFRKELPAVQRGTEKQGVWLDTKRNLPESRIRHKSHNYLNNVRGRLELPSLKDAEGLFLTEQGFASEGITSNLFWMKNEILFTPSIETGILPGTTRASVIQLAESLGMEVKEGFYPKEEVEEAEEAFVTNAIQELVPLSTIGEQLLPGADGTYYRMLHDAYVQAATVMKESDGKWN